MKKGAASRLLKSDTHEDDAPVPKKQRTGAKETSALLSNFMPTAPETPTTTFMKQLESDVCRGKLLFPADEQAGVAWATPADAAPNSMRGDFVAALDDFDAQADRDTRTNNTLAIKFSAPADSRRFSLNIAQKHQADAGFDSILFHFNPRQREKGGQIVLNSKSKGSWGQALQIPLSRFPLIFGQESCTLQIQIHTEGFDVFFGNQHCARFEHGRQAEESSLLGKPGRQNLCLHFPSTDDYGNPENWSVSHIWWGYKSLMAAKPLVINPSQSSVPTECVAGVNSHHCIHPRKLFLRGLPRIFNTDELELRRAQLERAFSRYGGQLGLVQVTVLKKFKTFAFIEFESEQLAALALREMSQVYPQLIPARQTKHEALQDARKAQKA